MGSSLAALCGLAWTAVYVLAIRQGIRDRTFAMPIAALATNISWEFQFSFVRPPDGVVQHVINVLWFAADCGLVWTVLRYGRREFPYLSRWAFGGCFAALLAFAYAGMDLVSTQLDDGGGTITAFGSNVVMSGLFLGMLASRRSTRGQSLGIALCKLIGTAAASVLTALDHDPLPRYQGGLLPYCYLACLLLDLAYVAALATVIRWERTTAPAPSKPTPAAALG
jgi:hypothetical protein